MSCILFIQISFSKIFQNRINETDDNNCTAVQWACMYNKKPDALKVLCEAKADLNIGNNSDLSGMTYNFKQSSNFLQCHSVRCVYTNVNTPINK